MERDELQEAQQKNRLAMRLEKGLGVPVDEARARTLYEEAAKAGDAAAQNNLGYRLQHGLCGFEFNEAGAVEWYEKAAAQDDASAIKNLGLCYLKGRGVKEDQQKARELMERARALGSESAEKLLNNLVLWEQQPQLSQSEPKQEPDDDGLFHQGSLHLHGQNGYQKDPAMAAKLFKEAAKKGHPYAAFELAQLLISGRGLDRNLEEARKWLSEAQKGKVPNADVCLKKIDRLESQPTPVAIHQDNLTILGRIKDIYKDQEQTDRQTDRQRKYSELSDEFDQQIGSQGGGILAFHLGSLALAGCSHDEQGPDVVNALYYFKQAESLGYLWGGLGVALIDKSAQDIRMAVAEKLVSELERKNQENIEALDAHNMTFAGFIQKYHGKNEVSLISIFRAFFLRNSDADAAIALLKGIKQQGDESQVDRELEKVRLLAKLFQLKFEINATETEDALKQLEKQATDLREVIDILKMDTFNREILSAVNSCLAELRDRKNGVTARAVEQHLIAIQSHTMRNPLGNARSLIKDIKRWMGTRPDDLLVGLTSLESTMAIVSNLIDAKELLLDSSDEFLLKWNSDNEQEVTLAQVICEATQQAVVRLTAREFGLDKLSRKLDRATVDKAASKIALLDLSEEANQTRLKSGFPSPFEYIHVNVGNAINYSFGSDGIRRRFFFTVIHELVFNAVKYEGGTDAVLISARSEDGFLVITCQNSRSAKDVSIGGRRGQDFIRQMLMSLKSVGAELSIDEKNCYLVELRIPVAFA